jgi:DNA primase
MPRYDQSVIREVHSRIDIATFIGQYVTLRKRGRDLVGLCPFHGEKTPSFHVHPEEGYFKCFGCGVAGDVIAFVQKLENLTFPDAIRVLATKAGVELEPEDPRAARVRSEREAIYEANAIAAAYFAGELRGPSGAPARAYCERRGFGEAILTQFGIGYAPDGWNGLVDELRANNVDLEIAAKAGLVKQGQRGHYDFYRNRLMVPTKATTGETIAFGGRALGDEEPKYLNTSTTPVYTKGDHLFALNIARRAVAADRTLIVVEGYLDCMALHQVGFGNAVAALGTSFTDKQATELKKYADNIFLCFDGDAAGASAATKAVDIASKVIEHSGMSLRVVALPTGDDPDTYVRAHGAAGFRALLDAAKPAIEFKIDAEVDRLAGGFESRSVIARKAEAMIHDLAPREEWDRWRQYVAGRLKVNVDDLRNSRFLANTANFAPRASSGSPGSRHVNVGVQPFSVEREILTILLEDPTLVSEFADRISLARFRNEIYARIYERIVSQASSLRNAADVFAACADDESAHEALASLGRDRSSTARYGDRDERRAHLERISERLNGEDEKVRYAELSTSIDEMFNSGEAIPDGLRSEFNALAAKLKLKK